MAKFFCSNGQIDMEILVDDMDQDFDGTFKAIDLDNMQTVYINGWQMSEFERIDNA